MGSIETRAFKVWLPFLLGKWLFDDEVKMEADQVKEAKISTNFDPKWNLDLKFVFSFEIEPEQTFIYPKKGIP